MPFCWKVVPCTVAGEGEGSQVKVYSRENNRAAAFIKTKSETQYI